MTHVNIEIKARCDDPGRVRSLLEAHGAEFRGLDRQIDTYFACPAGRLKLRQGTIENALIHYHRPDQAGPKRATVTLTPLDAPLAGQLHATLSAALAVLAVVDKQREIYFIDNVKFHIDRVAGLGNFVEIEAIDAAGELGPDALRRQCSQYMQLLGVAESDLLTGSYSDMLARRAGQGKCE